MSSTVISVENLSKVYRLGQIGTGTLTNDIKVWWARARGKPNPLLKIGQSDHGNVQGENLWALRDVSFKVEQGEVLGIIGRNGAGKSTLLKILSRVTAPTSGSVKVKGRIASLLEVGTGFHPELTGRENIYLNGAILGMTREEVRRKFDEIVEFAGIEDFIDTPVKRYSSGMYVRLAFAVAAHLESEILLVDEVLAVGDAEFQKKSLGKMGDVASKEGRTVLFVSHNMGAISKLCTHTVLIDRGSIISKDITQNVVNLYLTRGTPKQEENLLDYKDRKGNKRAIITNFKLANSNGGELINCESQLMFTLNYISNDNIKNLSVLIGIYDNYSRPVFFLDSEMVSGLFRNIPSKGKITCTTDRIRLTSGFYFINVALIVDNQISDHIMNVTSFNVELFDYFQNGKILQDRTSLLYIDQIWRIIDE